MKKTIQHRLIAGSILLFTIAFGVNIALNSSSVDKLCEEAMLSQYQMVGEHLQRMLLPSTADKQMGPGDSVLDHMLQMSEAQLLSINRSGPATPLIHEKQPASISLIGPEMVILASTNPAVLSDRLIQGNREFSHFMGADNVDENAQWRSNDIYFLKFPLKDASGNPMATILITVSAKSVQGAKHVLLRTETLTLLGTFMVGVVLLSLICMNGHDTDFKEKSFSKTRLSWMLFAVICGAQISFTAITIFTFTSQYLKMNKEKARMSVGLLKDQIELANEQELSNSLRLVKSEALLRELIAASPELNDISIFDNQWHPLYIATRQQTFNCMSATSVQIENIKKTLPEWDPQYNVRLTLDQGGQIQGYLSANISKPVLYDRLIDIALDSITILVISILFLVEMMIFIFHIVNVNPDTYQLLTSLKSRLRIRGFQKMDAVSSIKETVAALPINTGADLKPTVHYGLMRPAAFLLLFGYDLSISFLPLHTEKLYAPMFGLSKDLIMGLPISIELFFVGVCILLSGIWLDKRGWHEPFIAGLAMAAMGTLYSWGAPDVVNFIVSRAITGSGYGLALMASQGFVIEYSDASSKAQGLAYLFAGIYAGSLCGGATGAMLADRYEYSSVFFTGALILLSVIVYAFVFMRDGMVRPTVNTPPSATLSPPGKKLANFLSNRIVIALVFFSSLPAAIAVVGFLNYFSPIYLKRIGASQSTIGRILMIYGICLIYIGPLVSKYVDASNKKRLYIFMGCALGSMAFMTFQVIEGIIAASVSMLLLGLSSSLVLASQSAYTLRLKVTEELGAGKSIGIFRSTSRGGQVLGPIVFSGLIVSTNIEQGVAYFGLAYLASAILFLLFTIKDKQQMLL